MIYYKKIKRTSVRRARYDDSYMVVVVFEDRSAIGIAGYSTETEAQLRQL